MKKLSWLLLIAILLLATSANAQFNKLKNKVENKVKQRIDNKTDRAIDKGLDKVEEGAQGGGEGAGTEEGSNGNGDGTSATAKPKGAKAYSKYDFVPGEKIVYAEDFAQDVVGEFPVDWNTNSSGEVVTLEGQTGKWLWLKNSSKYQTPFKTKLPENYTVEFDLLMDYEPNRTVPQVFVEIVNLEITAAESGRGDDIYSGINLQVGPAWGTAESPDAVQLATLDKNGKIVLNAEKQLHKQFEAVNKKNKPVHVSIWVQKQRIRVWLNEQKLYDLPRALPPGIHQDLLHFAVGNYGGPQENFSYYISNIKIAQAAPDTRSKLLNEGKWSTTGILFDVNSDRIKPTSAGTLKEIATVLGENAELRVKIFGHTDSDGDDKANLELSKKRAAAVKVALSKDYNIEADRMETDGLGESKPTADNKTPEGKAQNRRVEFVKL